ncbi:MAG: glutaredoxin family protein [Candidatus Nealsonbacteria bacterium]
MRKLIFTIFVLFFVLSSANFSLAQDKVSIKSFFSPICPHCAKARPFLESLEEKYPNVEFEDYDAFQKQNTELLKQNYEEYNVPVIEYGLVPITFIGERYFLGFDEAMGAEIESYVLELLEKIPETKPQEQERKITLPIIGEISLLNLSPAVLAITLGALDGFNACAMIALGFLLTVLVSTGIRERVFLIGGTFILVSGIMYFIFISAWLNLFLVLEQINYITFIVGIIIIMFSLFLLKDYSHNVICRVCEVDPSKKDNIFVRFEKRLFEKMQEISQAKTSLPLMLLGVVVVAAGINLVELVCSLGFPLAFTKMLTTYNLSISSYYSYLLLYILFYMIDDLIIFALAIWTLRITQVSEKYLKAIKLISGIVLLILGLIILFKPEILMLI